MPFPFLLQHPVERLPESSRIGKRRAAGRLSAGTEHPPAAQELDGCRSEGYVFHLETESMIRAVIQRGLPRETV